MNGKQGEHSFIDVRIINLYNHSENQFGGFWENLTQFYLMTQLMTLYFKCFMFIKYHQLCAEFHSNICTGKEFPKIFLKKLQYQVFLLKMNHRVRWICLIVKGIFVASFSHQNLGRCCNHMYNLPHAKVSLCIKKGCYTKCFRKHQND